MRPSSSTLDDSPPGEAPIAPLCHRLDELSSWLLPLLLKKFQAQRAYFFCADTTKVDRAPRLVAAVEGSGEGRTRPDYPLAELGLGPDRPEVWENAGAWARAGADEGHSHPALFLVVPLDGPRRGLFVLHGRHDDRPFTSEAPELLEREMRPHLVVIRLLDRLERQARELATHLRGEGGTGPEEPDGEAPPGATFQAGDVVHYHGMITRADSMRELFSVIDRIKDTDLSTLIVGETGTGKELVARAIHFGSVRAKQPFEVVPCGSLPPNLLESELFGYRKGAFSGAEGDRAGVFERADGGTVFLDEVGDMPSEMQQKILRVLQEKEIRPIGADQPVTVNVRVLASTHRDLEALVEKKRFREDLFYRLNGFTLKVPPLREHREDIPLLLDRFLGEVCEGEESPKTFSESAYRELTEYYWPGNVQELRNVVTRSVLATPKRTRRISRKVVLPLLSRKAGSLFQGDNLYQEGDELRIHIPVREGFNDIVGEVERLIILTALRRNRGNKSRVTQQLGIPRQTLYNKIDKYGIEETHYLREE